VALTVVATALVSGLFIDEFDYFYPLRVVVGLLVLAWYRQEYVVGVRRQLHSRSLWSWLAARPAFSTLMPKSAEGF
jgi:hypothetical protein